MDKLDVIRFSQGRGTSLAKAKNKTLPWDRFVVLFKTPVSTGEKFRDYLKLPVDEQNTLKAVNGWYYRCHIDGERRNRRSGQPSDLITLDFDYATPAFLRQIKAGKFLKGYRFFAHSTRRHTDEKPRIRILIHVARPIDNEDYNAASRIVCQQEFDPEMAMVDKVSFRPAQMMFMPTVSKDSDWFWHEQDGKPYDIDRALDIFDLTVGDWHDISKLPVAAGEKLRETADKAEDPKLKKGPVGDFCRAYSVPEALDKFLPGLYVPVEDGSLKPRYTYTKGSTTNGAVIEDDGDFIYSHHGSDPASDRLCNAFDIVRIHLFGKEDQPGDEDLPIGQQPSFKAMLEFIKDDPGYREQAIASRYDITAMYDDIPDDDPIGTPDEIDTAEVDQDDFDDVIGTPSDKPAKRRIPGDSIAVPPVDPPAPKKNWITKLDVTPEGVIKLTLPNLINIIIHDARTRGRVRLNTFNHQVSLVKPFGTKGATALRTPKDRINGERWTDADDISLRSMLELPFGEGKPGYGLRVSDRDIVAAVNGAASQFPFHPILDGLKACVWDGEPRVEGMAPRFFGTKNSPYYREVMLLTMVASVARIFEPGHKFDNAPIIEGRQGIRKSTFVKVLYGANYHCEIDCDLDDRARVVELISGKWVGELPELGALQKSDFNAAKAFMRRQHDDVRLAYDRRVTSHPRQTVFWGTTNERRYLKDPTGNRSFWPVFADVPQIDVNLLAQLQPQLWAEAVHIYRRMRQAQPFGELNLALSAIAEMEARDKQEEARPEELAEEYAQTISIWADTPIPLARLLGEYGITSDKFVAEGEPDPETIMVVRTVWRQEDALEYALGLKQTLGNVVQKQLMEKTYGYLPNWIKLGDAGGRRFGIRARWRVRKDANEEDRVRGYRVVGTLDDYSDVI